MKPPTDAYREGYEKGRAANLVGHTSEAIFGMMRDDPGGHFATGYRDGAGGKKFTPPSDEARKPVPEETTASGASDLERSWYRLCNGSDFIPLETVDQYVSALRAEGKNVAIVIGLSDFTSYTCPSCGSAGQFKIHFLGRIEHAVGQCGWKGYMGTGSYIGFQISQIFHSGARAGGGIKGDADKKGDRSGGWIYGIVAFMMVAVFRAALAVVLIPLHAILALCQPKQAKSDVVIRVIVLAVFAAAAAIGAYEITVASNRQFTASQPAGIASYVVVSRCHACAWEDWQTDTLEPLARAGFQTVTGTLYPGGRIVQTPATSWAVDIVVGPFSNDPAAQEAMRRLTAILRPIALAHISWNLPDDIGENQAGFAGYSLRIVK